MFLFEKVTYPKNRLKNQDDKPLDAIKCLTLTLVNVDQMQIDKDIDLILSNCGSYLQPIMFSEVIWTKSPQLVPVVYDTGIFVFEFVFVFICNESDNYYCIPLTVPDKNEDMIKEIELKYQLFYDKLMSGLIHVNLTMARTTNIVQQLSTIFIIQNQAEHWSKELIKNMVNMSRFQSINSLTLYVVDHIGKIIYCNQLNDKFNCYNNLYIITIMMWFDVVMVMVIVNHNSFIHLIAIIIKLFIVWVHDRVFCTCR